MISKGLLVELDARPGKDGEVEAFLQSALPMVATEEGTKEWFGFRFGRSRYGILDVFPDDLSRQRHLAGPVARALQENADRLLATPPAIQTFDVLASKLPDSLLTDADTKALLLTFEAKEGHEKDAEAFLRGAQDMVEAEPDTTSWFALKLNDGKYGIFDSFPDNTSRFKHLIGRVPRQLAKKSPWLLGGLPDMEMLNVVAEKRAMGEDLLAS